MDLLEVLCQIEERWATRPIHMQNADRVFYFHADANAVGGVLTHPEQRLLSVGGSCSLPQAGGTTHATLDNFAYNHLLKVKKATTHATGTTHAGAGWSSLVTSVVEGVNMMDVLTADRITARLYVKHPQQGYEPEVSIVGSSFENLRLSGNPLELPILSDLFQLPNGEKPDSPWPANARLVRLAKDQSEEIASDRHLHAAIKHRYTWVQSDTDRATRGFLLCSIVEEIRGKVTGSSVGHIITVPGFGTLFLGELMVTGEVFRLSMVRAELDCSVGGTVSLACADSNGRPMP